MNFKSILILVAGLLIGLGNASGAITDNLVWLGHFNGDSVLPDVSTPASTVYANTAATTGATGYPFNQTPQAALTFDGTLNHALTYSYVNTTDLRYHGTISAWVQPDTLKTQMLYGTTRATDNLSHYFMATMWGTAGTQIRLFCQSTGYWDAIIDIAEAQKFEANKWSNVIVTWDNPTSTQGQYTLSLYVDGVLQSTLTNKNFTLYEGALYLGSGITSLGSNNVSLDGQMDEAAIWGKALSSTEVTAVYDHMKAGNQIGSVPEPATLGLLGLGSLILACRRR